MSEENKSGKNIAGAVILLLMLTSVAGNVLLLAGCKTFNPNDYIIEGQPAECNDYYITIAAYYKSSNKDFAFPATIYEACKQARNREQKIADLCGRLYERDPKGFRECVK